MSAKLGICFAIWNENKIKIKIKKPPEGLQEAFERKIFMSVIPYPYNSATLSQFTTLKNAEI